LRLKEIHVEALFGSSREVSLEAVVEKTKYLLISYQNERQDKNM
jgi:hypothetical protein